MKCRRLPRLVVLLLLVALAPRPGAAQTAYVAFGDSITAGWGFDEACTCDCPEECGYPIRLEAMLRAAGRDATVENHGLGGESTAEGLSRLPSVLDPGDDVLLLMEGTNDVARGISLETTLFNLDEMARVAAARGLSTVHATVIPRVPGARHDKENRVTQELDFGIRELAWGRDRRLADPFEVFWSVPDRYATLYYTGADNVGHPNAAGFELMAETFFDVLQGIDSVPPVPAELSPPDGSDKVPPSAEIHLRLLDFGSGIDASRTRLLIDGQAVSATASGTGDALDLRYQPATPFAGVVRVGYESADLATPSNTVRREDQAELVIAGTTFLAGDIDRDGRVDGADLVRLARAFGASKGQARFDSAADLNDDAVVDGVDLALLAANFGKRSF